MMGAKKDCEGVGKDSEESEVWSEEMVDDDIVRALREKLLLG